MSEYFARLSAVERARLQMSVGYAGNRGGRPLAPMEVAQFLGEASRNGVPLEECASFLNLRGTTQVKRFLRILELPPDLAHLVVWGASRDGIGLSCAVELLRIEKADARRAVAAAILKAGLTSREVRQVAQISHRSGRSIDDCIEEVLGMRPTIERRHVVICSVDDRVVKGALENLTQTERDALLAAGLGLLGLVRVKGRLGTELITLVTDQSGHARLSQIGRRTLERELRAFIEDRVTGVR